MMPSEPEDLLMTALEVARCFKVDPKTVNRWARAGVLRTIRTPGGQRRFYRDEIMQKLMEGRETAS